MDTRSLGNTYIPLLAEGIANIASILPQSSLGLQSNSLLPLGLLR